MLKLEPREADRLPVPAPALIADNAAALTTIDPAVRAALASGDLLGAVRTVDDVLLSGALGITDAARAALADTHAQLTNRRVSRGANAAAAATSGR